MTDAKATPKIRPAPFTKITSTGPGKANYVADGTFTAPSADKLDALMEAYRKHIFDVVSKAPGLVYYALIKDEKESAFRSLSVWTSWEASEEFTNGEVFDAAKKAFMEAVTKASAQPKISFKNLPLYASIL